jgi:hypothetical protein
MKHQCGPCVRHGATPDYRVGELHLGSLRIHQWVAPVPAADLGIGLLARRHRLHRRGQRRNPSPKTPRGRTLKSRGARPEEAGSMRRYLIVGNQTLAGGHLSAKVRELHQRGPSSFYIVVPATPPHGHSWSEGEARDIARRRRARSPADREQHAQTTGRPRHVRRLRFDARLF